MYSNIYYSPEKFGLKVVLDVDKSDGCYQFDQFVIWEGYGGRYYWGEDSGCSCPSPFEDAGLDTLRQGSLLDAIDDARAWTLVDSYYDAELSEAKKSIERFASENGL
jgi:hypothetical protein